MGQLRQCPIQIEKIVGRSFVSQVELVEIYASSAAAMA